MGRQGKKFGNSMWSEAWRSFSHNKTGLLGLFMLIVLIVTAVFAYQIAPHGFDDQNLIMRFKPPSSQAYFGTDNLGRDVFSRVVIGSRYSLVIGIAAATFSCIMGVILGAVAGFYNEFTDNIIMRAVDLVNSIPSILLAISIIAALGNGLQNVIIAVAISATPNYARTVRASVLSIKDLEYIEASYCIGSSKLRTLFRHVLPNCMAPIIVSMSLSVSQAILAASSLSFIGLGIQPPTPEWGAMLSAGRPFIRNAWWIITFPGLAIMMIILSLNLLGDGLRDALDPRLKR